MEIPTRLVTIKATGNPARINVADFDDAVHAEPASKPEAPAAVEDEDGSEPAKAIKRKKG